MVNLNSAENLPKQNRLLASLPSKELKRFVPKLQEVDLSLGTVIYNRGHRIDHVYFPTSCVGTLLAVGESELTLEVGMVGREGVIGLPVFLGDDVADFRAVVQADGSAMRMAAKDFAIECRKGETLRQMLLHFSKLRMVQTSIASACHRFHDIEKRLVRWILMTADRIENSEILVTHDLLTKILGVPSEEVTRAAADLAKKDLISLSRDRLLIPDRTRLEAAACKCYRIISEEERSFPVVH